MKRELLVGLTAAVMLTGCAAEQKADPDGVPHVVGHDLIRPVVDIDILPPELPAAVHAQIPNVVVTKAARGQNEIARGTGVRLTPAIVMTAGHMVRQASGSLYPGITACDQVAIQTPTKPSRAGDTVPLDDGFTPKHGTELPIDKQVSRLDPQSKTATTPDIALLRVFDLSRGAQPFVPNKITPDPLRLNQPMYTINYESTADGKIRTPYEAAADLTLGAAAIKPAQIGAVIIGHQRNGVSMAINGLRGYGPDHDATIRPGASGGPVYNSRGQLAGIVIRAGRASVTELESEFGIDIKGAPSSEVDTALIEPITVPIVRAWLRKLADSPHC